MCNPALIGVALLAAGTGASYIGQKKGAKAAQREMDREQAYQQGLRKKSLEAAGETIKKNDPRQLAADIAAPQAIVDASQASAADIAKVAQASDGTPNEGQVYQGAVADAGRAVRPQATRQGLQQGFDAQDQALRLLAHENLFLGEDSRRSLATLESRLARAGRKGHGLRTAGKLASVAGGALVSGGLYGPAAGAGASAVSAKMTAAQAQRARQPGAADLYGRNGNQT